MEFDALASNSTGNGEDSSRSGAIVVSTRCTDAPKGATTVVVAAYNDSIVGVYDRSVTTSRSWEVYELLHHPVVSPENRTISHSERILTGNSQGDIRRLSLQCDL